MFPFVVLVFVFVNFLQLCSLTFPPCRDFDTADKVLPTVPKEQRTRVAHFLEKQGFRKQALAVSSDPEHKFDLAIQLGDLDTAYSLANRGKQQFFMGCTYNSDRHLFTAVQS